MAGRLLEQGVAFMQVCKEAVYLKEAVLVGRGLAILDAGPREAAQALQCRNAANQQKPTHRDFRVAFGNKWPSEINDTLLHEPIFDDRLGGGHPVV